MIFFWQDPVKLLFEPHLCIYSYTYKRATKVSEKHQTSRSGSGTCKIVAGLGITKRCFPPLATRFFCFFVFVQLSLWHLQRSNRLTSPRITPSPLYLKFMFAKLVAGCTFFGVCVLYLNSFRGQWVCKTNGNGQRLYKK